VRFVVTDSGIGIPADKLEAIFDEFTQVDSTTARRYGGTGLGLSICRRLVRMMGGEVAVSSALGHGSEFSFALDLPCRDGGAAAPGLAAPPCDAADAATPLGLRVLLAEDNAVNRHFAVAALAAIGCEVDVARDGEEALRLVAAQRYDVVLMDCQMPVVDGYEAARRIRAAGHTVPIVALTADAMHGDRERCLAAGMNEYMSKPIAPAALRRVVAACAPQRAPAHTGAGGAA
jgi:CheY-like chemotaxis protein